MIEERISEVRLRVRTNIGDAAELRPVAERMMRTVLERCSALLEERAPGRVVLIRRLALNWRVDESAFSDEANVEELAHAAADAIERISRPPVLDPPASAEGAVIFDDEAHFRASHLLALARGGPAWFHSVLETSSAGDPLAALAAPERREIAHDTLMRLAREGVLAEVLAARPASAVAVFAAALGCDGNGLGRANGDVPNDFNTISMASELRATVSHWPPLSPPALSLALRVHAAALLDAPFAAHSTVALAEAVSRGADLQTPEKFDTHSPRASHDEDVREEQTSATGRCAVEQISAGESECAGQEFQDALAETVVTRCAGLFYLFDRVQELDLAESLWKACLPEGVVLAAAATALLGPAFTSDPAPALFGGTTNTACPPVLPEQHEEIAIATCRALAAALPRRGLAAIPPATVALADHPAGRLLIATADHSPFVFFSWPSGDAEMLRAGLRALLDCWPHYGVLAASPALANLDVSGRLRASSKTPRGKWLLPDASSAAAAALLAMIVGAPCLLFAARTGAGPIDSAEAFVTRFIAQSGRVRVGVNEMDILLRGEDLDLAVRRTALDRDPGWLPWLRRTVHFHFEEQPGGGIV